VADAPKSTDTVVLLHGLGLNRLAMARMASSLRRAGYQVVNPSYDSRRIPLEELASTWLPSILRAHVLDTPASLSAARVHFVTHSMGGIVLRAYLRDHTLPRLGRIVMLAPPNQGSEVADHLRKNYAFRFFTGVNGLRLGTDAASLPRQLGPTTAELGIIAGRRSLNPLFSSWIAGPDDGKVSVASARLDGMRDFIVLPISHTWLQWRATVIAQTKTFLLTGKFAHPPSP